MVEHTHPVQIDVLGPLRVRVDGVPTPISSSKQRQLLARMVVAAGEVVSAGRLIDALWGESPPATAAKNLQVLVGRLRAAIGSMGIESIDGGYRIDMGVVSIDAIRFERRASRAGTALVESHLTDARAELAEAGALWRGEVAQELDAPWGAAVVTRWTQLRRWTEDQYLRVRVELDPSPEMLEELAAAIDRNPHGEALRVVHATALRRAGRIAEARAVIVDALHVLDRDLGLAPGPELADLATEYNVPVPAHSAVVQAPMHPRFDAVLSGLGMRFDVAEALAAATAHGLDEIDLLDELEHHLDRGVLVREVDADGRVYLVQAERR